jgi:putative transposase
MNLTYKIKHNIDYSIELAKAKQIAEWAINNKFKTSSKYVSHIGLKSAISNQILKKYGQNKKAKSVNKIKLTIPGANKNIQIRHNEIYVPCLNKLTITPWFDISKISKINQIEIDNDWYYITCEVKENIANQVDEFLGIDLNTSSYAIVIASGIKILKRAKDLFHIKKKYANKRRRLQKQSQYRTLKKIKNRENRIIKDKLHKLTREIVDIAKNTNKGIRLENLTHIRKNTNTTYKGKKLRYSTNNWNYSQFRQMIEYKSKICGVPVEVVNPAYTSKTCSRCGKIGARTGKKFKCENLTCNHVDHADANAAFNIALAMMHIAHIGKEPDMKGMSSPEGATDIWHIRPEATKSLVS